MNSIFAAAAIITIIAGLLQIYAEVKPLAKRFLTHFYDWINSKRKKK